MTVQQRAAGARGLQHLPVQEPLVADPCPTTTYSSPAPSPLHQMRWLERRGSGGKQLDGREEAGAGAAKVDGGGARYLSNSQAGVEQGHLRQAPIARTQAARGSRASPAGVDAFVSDMDGTLALPSKRHAQLPAEGVADSDEAASKRSRQAEDEAVRKSGKLVTGRTCVECGATQTPQVGSELLLARSRSLGPSGSHCTCMQSS
jgi:hypothetical protein